MNSQPLREPPRVPSDPNRLTQPGPDPGAEHVRTLHHFAATGGTLVAKCLAALPDVVLLSEVTPSWRPPQRPGFTRFLPAYPLGAAEVMENGLGVTFEERRGIFLAQIRLIQARCRAAGRILVLRDHAHTDYCRSDGTRSPALRLALQPHYRLSSIVTVRHPVDSYLSALKRDWLKGLNGFEDYCERLADFLDGHAGLPVFRYEDFVDRPEEAVQAMASSLSLGYDPDFRTRFPERSFGADSGRGRDLDHIRPLPPNPYPPEAGAQWERGAAFRGVADRLGYPPTVAEFRRQRTEAAEAAAGAAPSG